MEVEIENGTLCDFEVEANDLECSTRRSEAKRSESSRACEGLAEGKVLPLLGCALRLVGRSVGTSFERRAGQ